LHLSGLLDHQPCLHCAPKAAAAFVAAGLAVAAVAFASGLLDHQPCLHCTPEAATACVAASFAVAAVSATSLERC
jgi:hypothetical protein